MKGITYPKVDLKKRSYATKTCSCSSCSNLSYCKTPWKTCFQQPFLESNKIIDPLQSGFWKNHSTETALCHSSNQWFVNMDHGFIDSILFLHIKKAFDTDDYAILIAKIRYYGISGTALQWFQSYLNNRKQICKVYQKCLTSRVIRSGVPQGSNLGPSHLLLYINDLPKSLRETNPAFNMWGENSLRNWQETEFRPWKCS